MWKLLNICILFLILSCRQVFGQIDTEFWFAAPEITQLHADRPIYLRLSALSAPATVTISQPANSSFPVINTSIAANSTITIDLTSRINYLENSSPNQVDNKGLLIRSSADISAYYEVFGSNSWGQGTNSDIFTLKGKNALGNKFYTPFQTHWDNYQFIDAWASFDIIATEDNTQITITPTKDLVGHPAGIPFNITLNKGQTYSARALSHLASERPTGSLVVSNKPIAITLKDDSVYENPNYDVLGDQLIPVSVTEMHYIVIGASFNLQFDRAYICATENSTDIFVNGVYQITINAGQTHEHLFTDSAVYINTSAPSYLFHVTGFGPELAGALLPGISCTGSRQIGFTRSYSDQFAMNIIVKTGGEGNFSLNGNNTLIPADSFKIVPGTSGNWKYTQLSFSTTIIPSGSTNLIANTSHDFHLGIVNGSPNITGLRYGYFSDYGSVNLGPNQSICRGDSTVFNAGLGKSSYLWNTGASSNSIIAKDSGTYWVEIAKDTCTFSDTVILAFFPEITQAILDQDTSVCANTSLIIQPLNSFSKYVWQDGSTGSNYTPTASGTYWVDVYDQNNCTKRDSIDVILRPYPIFFIVYNKEEENFCRDSTVNLDLSNSFQSYNWSTGHTTKSLSTSHHPWDEYWVSVTDFNGCSNTDTLKIDCSPYITEPPNLITRNSDGKNDILYVAGLKPGKWILEVYNNWGNMVFLSKSYHNEFDGKGLSEGIYFYHLKHVDLKKQYKGWLHIIN
jgi:hypothetical protein